MKAAPTAVIASILLSGFCLAQDTPTPPPQQMPQTQQATGQPDQSSQRALIAPGSVIPVQLTRTIDAKKVKPGDEVEAKVTQDLKTSTGKVVMPKDTKVIGHVTEAQARSKEQKESQLGIAFDHAVMNGNTASLPMSIQAVIGQQNHNPANDNASGAGSASPGSGGGIPSSNSGRPGSMGGGGEQAPNSYPQGAQTPNGSTNNSNPSPAITANTSGVLGISNYKLETQNAAQGSVVSSEKGNVKLESGTMMLLRVSQ